MRQSKLLPLLPLIFLGLSAHADPKSPPPAAVQDSGIENDYATTLLSRPLILPKGLSQVGVSFQIDHNGDAPPATFSGVQLITSDATRMGAGYEMGVGGGIQLGALLSMQLSPESSLQSAFLDAQYGLSREKNIRLDFGTQHFNCGFTVVSGGIAPDSTYSALFGLGLPMRFQVDPKLAIQSGSNRGADLWDDVFVWDSRSCGKTGVFHIPVSVVFQTDEVVAFNLGLGYRRTFGGGTSGTNFIPLKLEGVMTIVQHTDVGFGVQYPGKVGSGDPVDLAEYPIFEARLFIWAAHRI